jgi:hypothetical protein
MLKFIIIPPSVPSDPGPDLVTQSIFLPAEIQWVKFSDHFHQAIIFHLRWKKMIIILLQGKDVMKYFLVIIWLIASFGTHLAKRLHASLLSQNLCEFSAQLSFYTYATFNTVTFLFTLSPYG